MPHPASCPQLRDWRWAHSVDQHVPTGTPQTSIAVLTHLTYGTGPYMLLPFITSLCQVYICRYRTQILCLWGPPAVRYMIGASHTESLFCKNLPLHLFFKGSCYVVQASLKLKILLPQPPGCSTMPSSEMPFWTHGIGNSLSVRGSAGHQHSGVQGAPLSKRHK